MNHQDRVNREVNSIINGIFQEQSRRISLIKKEYFEISIYEIEKQIEKHLKLTVEIIPDDELHNGYTPITYAKSHDHSENVKNYKNNRWAMNLCDWLEHLMFLNVLPEGNFLVDHSW